MTVLFDAQCAHCDLLKERSGRARAALSHYETSEEPETGLQDLISDLLHLASVAGYDVALVLQRAVANYNAEQRAEDLAGSENEKVCANVPQEVA